MSLDLAQIESCGCEFPQTRRGHERRLSLLLSANTLFLERGYDAVSLDDIVNHAGGSKASIYKYFGNKEGLFIAICDYHRELFFKDICVPFNPEIDDLKNYLVETLINFYRHIIDPEHTAFMRLVMEQSQRNPDIARYLHEKGPKFIQMTIANILSRAVEQGKLVCPNPLYSGMFYFGILRNCEWRIMMGLNEQFPEQEMIEYIKYCVDRFLDGHQKV
ncbi:TetR/AcrR family transcriptional regulator [Acinetobacter stercoris]|uniref:Putative DNA-binding transcriptional regulator n=1 Tax=Acinetobacter stercoris TaxID=2126983 RepID=A0A2U3MUA2_9GAMM|nr:MULTISPECIES: TetR/AcrR family transcriptional regulator [Acinetobacter]SPL69020.1 putative DNA-binding transcriptional regulator [Acinetobacter stercoris]